MTGTLLGLAVGSIVLGRRQRLSEAGCDVADLARALRRDGQRQPVLIGPGRQLIDGWRRVMAARQLDWPRLRVVVANDVSDAVAHLKNVPADETTVEMTLTERAYVGFALESLPRGKAGIKDAYRGLVGQALHLSSGSWQRLRTVVLAASRHDLPPETVELARTLLAQLEAGEIVVGTAARLLSEQRNREGWEASHPPLVGADAQRRALQTSAARLSGIATVLEQIREFELDRDELAGYVTELSTARTKLSKTLSRARVVLEEGNSHENV